MTTLVQDSAPIAHAFACGLIMPRSFPAFAAAGRLLADGDWHRWTDVVDAMTAASDLQPKSASNRLHQLVTAGVLERRGRHPHRELRLLPS